MRRLPKRPRKRDLWSRRRGATSRAHHLTLGLHVRKWLRPRRTTKVRRMRRRAILGLGGAVGGLVVLAGGGVALVDAEVVPGKSRLNQALGRCDAKAPATSLRAAASEPVGGSFTSKARHREVPYFISYPPGFAAGAKLPVCLALHGFGSDARAAIGAGDYPQFIAGAVKAGAAPFA